MTYSGGFSIRCYFFRAAPSGLKWIVHIHLQGLTPLPILYRPNEAIFKIYKISRSSFLNFSFNDALTSPLTRRWPPRLGLCPPQ